MTVAGRGGFLGSTISTWALRLNKKMPEEELSIEVLCDLIQRELQNAIEDLAAIQEKKSQERRRFAMLKSALSNAAHYLGDLETKV